MYKREVKRKTEITYLCPTLLEHLKEKARQRAEDAIKYADARKQKMRIIDDLDGSKIPSTDLVNCLPNGTIQTLNSFKYPTREIKSKLGIAFKYHYLMIDFHCLFSKDDKRRLNLLLDNKRRKKMIKDVRKCSNILFPEQSMC